MSHIFISYSRKDIEIAQRIVTALAENELDTWVDWNSIPKGEDWLQEIYRGIEEADAFLFLVSQDSVISGPCNEEITHAVKNGKRILPVFIANVENKDVYSVTGKFVDLVSKEEINRRNFIFCRDGQDDFSQAIQEIRKTIQIDYQWLQYHRGLQVKAVEWKKTKDKSRLLRGKELREAKQKFAKINHKTEPLPTPLQHDFIALSGRDSQKRTISLSSIIFIMLCALCAAIMGATILLDHVPDTVNVDGEIFEIRNRFGYRFLEVNVGSTIAVNAEPQRLKKNGKYLMIVGTKADGERPGTVIAYDMSGNIVWQQTAHDDPYGGPTANFAIRSLVVDEIMNNGETQVVFTSQKTDWFPSELVLLSADGEVLSSYWNSGFIYDVIPQDFDNDGIKELVVSAVNNNLGLFVVDDPSLHPVIVYLLSPKDDFTGQTFPGMPGIPTKTEYNRWIAVFEPNFVLGVKVRIVQDAGENLIEVVYNNSGGYVHLDRLGRIRNIGVSDFWQSEYPNSSPVEFICFLQSDANGWYFPPRVDENGFCPWYEPPQYE